MPTPTFDQDQIVPTEPDIFPVLLTGLFNEQKANICQTLLAYGVSEEDLPCYIADLLGVIETVFDAYVAEKQGGSHTSQSPHLIS